ncbi:hypothetical protein Esti_000302 [Eimeria stiedai]
MIGLFRRLHGRRVLFLLLLLRDAAAFHFPQPSAPPVHLQYRQASPLRRSHQGAHLVQQNEVLRGSWRPQAHGDQALTAVEAAPQPTELRMPKVSSSGGGSKASAGFISAWHVQEGQHVKEGEPLFVVESDKADVDVEAPHKAGSVVGLLDHEAAASGNGGGTGAQQNETVSNFAQLTAGAVALFMPALSSTMTHGTITKWHKQEGDKIEANRILVVESDKADMEVEAFDAGYLAGVRAPSGTSAAVGDTIAYIVPKKEQVQELKLALEKHLATGGAPISKASAQAERAQPQPSSQPPAQAAAEDNAAEAAEIEKVAQAAAAEWISPSVDQASSAQQLPGASPQQLQQLLRYRLSSIAPAAAEALADQKMSQGLLRRAQLRLPPRVALLAKSTRFGSVQVLLTPAAEAFAAKHNVTVKSVRGTGFGGRITLVDVKQHIGMPAEPTKTQYSCNNADSPAQDKASNAQPSAVALTSLEKAIAKNMEATLDVPVFRLTRGISVDALFEMMKQLKSGDFADAASITAEEGFVAPGLSVLLAKAVALTLKKHPLLNARFDGEAHQIINPPSVDIAMAVSIKGGLVTPVLKDVGGRDVFTLARSWRHQVAAAQAHDFVTAGLTGGTFYISNLGMSAIEQFDALLPQNVGCIMAVGSVRNVLTPNTDNTSGLTHRKQMNVTLTCDHRHIYGQHAADFLTDLASLIEKAPNALLLA